MSSAVVVQLSISKGGVPKRPIPEAQLDLGGIAGDSWRHADIHGGPLQAVLLITHEGIDELIAQGFPLYPGALGENITTRGLDRRSLRSRQRYRIGEAVVELTKRRTPCETLNVYGPGIQSAIFDAQAKAGDPTSPRWGLSGFYASVVQPGVMYSGDSITLL